MENGKNKITESASKKTVQNANKVISALKRKYIKDVIKDYEIAPLVNINTGENIGFAVIIQLANKYEYGDVELNDWKEQFGAYMYTITSQCDGLTVKFRVRFDRKK